MELELNSHKMSGGCVGIDPKQKYRVRMVSRKINIQRKFNESDWRKGTA